MRSLRERGVPDDVIALTRGRVEGLPASGVLCHADMHPGNILMTADGPVIIDWISAIRADPMVDVTRQHVTLTMTGPAVGGGPAAQFAAATDAALVEAYAELSGTSRDAVLAAMAPFVPVMAALRMAESGCDGVERGALTAYVRATLGKADAARRRIAAPSLNDEHSSLRSE